MTSACMLWPMHAHNLLTYLHTYIHIKFLKEKTEHVLRHSTHAVACYLCFSCCHHCYGGGIQCRVLQMLGKYLPLNYTPRPKTEILNQ